MQEFRAVTAFKNVMNAGLIALTAALVACGGGGGSTATVAGPASVPVAMPASDWPVSGNYSLVFKSQGLTTARPLSLALSFAHPANLTVEYVLDATAAPNAAAELLEQGIFNSATQQVTGLKPFAFFDSPNGLVRTTAMVANGARPAQATGNTLALCGSKVRANNYATPYASRFVMSTPGPDGVCATADDGEAQVTFDANGAPNASPLTVGTSLGLLRSTSTGLPTHLFRGFADGGAQASSIPVSAASPDFSVVFAAVGATAGVVHKPVQNLNDIIVYTRNGALMALTGRTSVPSAATLSSVTGPDGWMSAGYDNNNVYSYLNSNTAASGAGNWRILATSRSTLATSTFAVGLGTIQSASISGGSVLFAAAVTSSSAAVYRIPTATGLVTPYLSSTGVVSVVSTGGGGVHTLVNVGASGLISSQIINDAGTVLFTSTGGTVFGIDNNSRNVADGTVVATSYIFAAPIGAAAFGGAALTRYDVAADTTRLLGTLPTGSSLGGTAATSVYVAPLIPTNGFGGVYAARAFSSTIQTTGAAVYTYNTANANSLTLTTSQVK